jgi:hypothetical protein
MIVSCIARTFVAALLAADLLVGVRGDLCFMLYQMADNNLESFIRDDNAELIQSELIKDPTVTTWIYFDALNFGTPGEFPADKPLENIYNADGSELTERYEGSRYFTYDHGMSKMIVDTTLPGEQNSDSPDVLYNFAVHALTDCVAKGSTDYFFAFSSHGGGFAGFGGDENIARRGRRKLLQSNYQIVDALSQALTDVPGAPEKYDVLGFDACLMMSLGALDDFHGITKFYLASEAVEPGHGRD